MRILIRTIVAAILAAVLALAAAPAYADLPLPTPDSSYGINGGATGTPNDRPMVRAVGVQSDGKIVQALSPRFQSEDEHPLNRLSEDGILDASFGNGGYVSGLALSPVEMDIAADDSIFVIGKLGDSQVLVKITPDGSLATDFGQDGILDLGARWGAGLEAVGIETSQSTVTVFGRTADNEVRQEEASLLRVDNNGRPVTSFGDNGVVIYDLDDDETTTQFPEAFTVDSANRPIIGISGLRNRSTTPTSTEPAAQLVRFSTSGVVETNYPGRAPNLRRISSLEALPTGGIVLGGIKVLYTTQWNEGLQWFDEAGAAGAWLPIPEEFDVIRWTGTAQQSLTSLTSMGGDKIAFAMSIGGIESADWVGTATSTDLSIAEVSPAPVSQVTAISVDDKGRIVIGGKSSAEAYNAWGSARFSTTTSAGKVESTTSLTVDPGIPIVAQSATVNIKVATADGPASGGTVGLSVNGRWVDSSQVSNGTAAIKIPVYRGAGTFSFRATYSGTDTVAPSSGAKRVTVASAPTDLFGWLWYFFSSWLASFA